MRSECSAAVAGAEAARRQPGAGAGPQSNFAFMSAVASRDAPNAAAGPEHRPLGSLYALRGRPHSPSTLVSALRSPVPLDPLDPLASALLPRRYGQLSVVQRSWRSAEPARWFAFVGSRTTSAGHASGSELHHHHHRRILSLSCRTSQAQLSPPANQGAECPPPAQLLAPLAGDSPARSCCASPLRRQMTEQGRPSPWLSAAVDGRRPFGTGYRRAGRVLPRRWAEADDIASTGRGVGIEASF